MCPALPSDLSFRGCERGVVGDAARSRGAIACAFAWSLQVRRGPLRGGTSVAVNRGNWQINFCLEFGMEYRMIRVSEGFAIRRHLPEF
ncbi:hypothetical protein PS2_015437 [Malus domestica]